MTHINSKLVHQGRSSAEQALAVNPPLLRASTTVFPSLAAFKSSYRGVTFETPRYGRSGTSTAFELQTAMASICNTQSCIATSCGLSACAAVLSAYAKPGAQLLIQKEVYGPCKALADNELTQQQVDIDYFDSPQQLPDLITPKTSLIFLEVPTSLSMKMLDIRAMAEIARQHKIPLACDATWGTPYFFDAHGLGINISIHAATKYINGHSDTLLGLITGSYQDLEQTRRWCERYGSHAAPDACWLTLRGLRTLSVRMERHQENALHVARYLQTQPQVKNVLFPALPSDPGHSLWQQQFSGAAGPFSIELQPCDEASFEKFIDSLKLFSLGTSWGGFESLVMPAIPHHLRSEKTLPDEGRMLRLHIGLEDKGDLCADLQQALSRLKTCD
ncbi:PLP-dependent transferase [Thalassomonas viridans]|uniref:PLP-dependent transferase n=1 Tax=Thalassomonas viridans TaxID=137584 RepID=A0AAE9Z666_9GAMM|nr:PLP-dependent aspartate aminotransferase family protein [Thalassomonas viridans]WDE07420.1 PLP-dependent transferase [Thalassomonas viridans]